MTKAQLLKRKLPDAPGVYFFLGRRKEILYIGKATSLRNRVRSYFDVGLHEKRSQLIKNMVDTATTLDFTVTDSVLEALILETNLIRTHKPKFNTISKDDKSYNHLVITNESFPRVLVIRGKDLTEKYAAHEIKYHFGPFPSGVLFREALKIVRRIFRFYDTPVPIGQERSKMARGKIDFNRQIGLYPTVQSTEEYQKTIRHIRLFFEGKKKTIIRELQRDMKRYAKEEEFEKAGDVKRKIFALQHIEDIALIRKDMRVYQDDRRVRIEAYDIAHLGGDAMVGVMTVVAAGVPEKNEYRKFKIETVSGANDTAALKEVLERRFNHDEWQQPAILVVDGSTAQANAAASVLKRRGLVIPVVGVVKNEKHQPQRIIGPRSVIQNHHDSILLANMEAHRYAIAFHRNKNRLKLK